MSSELKQRQFSLKFLVVAVTLAAICFACAQWLALGSTIVLGIVLSTFLFGDWRTRRAVLVLFPTIYAPFLIFALLGGTNWWMQDASLEWCEHILQLPGIIAAEPFIYSDMWFQEAVITLLASTVFLGLVAFARKDGYRLIGTTLIAFCLSLLSFGYAYDLFFSHM